MEQDKHNKVVKPKIKIRPSLLTILFAGIFLIFFIPLFLTYNSQMANQTTIKQQNENLQKILIGQQSDDEQRNTLETQLSKAQQSIEDKDVIFPAHTQSPEIVDQLLTMAKSNGIEITKMMISNASAVVKVGLADIDFPTVVFDMDLSGQIPMFQNFLLNLDNELPTAVISKIAFRAAAKEGDLDTANVIISILSKESTYAEHKVSQSTTKTVQVITDRQDKKTDPFKINSSRWYIDWKATPVDTEWAAFSFFVYPKNNPYKFTAAESLKGNKLSGTTYINKGNGDFFIQILTANISQWELKIIE